MTEKPTFAESATEELDLPFPLRPYQWVGINFLTQCQSAMLADEMGLGKTVQAAIALRLVLRLPGSDRALIITPSSLRLNWERELSRWASNLVVRRLQGGSEDRAATYRLPIPVLLTSYEQIRADARTLDLDIHFDVVILDEAQRIKNSDSATALACRLLPRTHAWVLTGTPLENTADDLLSIFGFLKPGLMRAGMSTPELHDRMQKHFLRRRKGDVLPDLPPLIIQDLPLELLGAQRESYDQAWDSRKHLACADGVPVSEAHLLALITKLKQLCNFDPVSGESVKLDSLQLILESLFAPTDKIIVFSQYVETLKWISQRLDDFPHDLFHGQLSESARDRVLLRFESEPGPRALLMSLAAGGVGLNLQAASAVVLFDRWWNPAVEDQAIQRAHRFGRDRPLHVFRFLVSDSIEERIAAVLRDKQMLFDRYVEQAESAVVRVFSRNELRRLLDLTALDVDGEPAPKEQVPSS